MTYAVTGHRPAKLGGYGKDTITFLTEFAIKTLKDIRPRPTRIITGMALGWDQAIADACVVLNTPFIAAVPFRGQKLVWPQVSQGHYNDLLCKAQIVQIVSEGGYEAPKMQIRNEWMVNECEAVIALWDGTTGGTGNCVKYAMNEQKKIINVWDKWVTFASIRKEKHDGDERRLRVEERRKRQNHV